MREDGGEVVILPDEFLKEGWMIWQMVIDLRRRQTVTIRKLYLKVGQAVTSCLQGEFIPSCFQNIINRAAISLTAIQLNLAFLGKASYMVSTP